VPIPANVEMSSKAVPLPPEWFHEIKYYGPAYRAKGRSRAVDHGGGHDWAGRYPWIAAAALKNRPRQFVIDGDAVVLGIDGYFDFNTLLSGRSNEEVPSEGYCERVVCRARSRGVAFEYPVSE
jgi:bifunctional non-homologous end joining protein LigD